MNFIRLITLIISFLIPSIVFSNTTGSLLEILQKGNPNFVSQFSKADISEQDGETAGLYAYTEDKLFVQKECHLALQL